jgi:hypothetical protein
MPRNSPTSRSRTEPSRKMKRDCSPVSVSVATTYGSYTKDALAISLTPNGAEGSARHISIVEALGISLFERVFSNRSNTLAAAVAAIKPRSSLISFETASRPGEECFGPPRKAWMEMGHENGGSPCRKVASSSTRMGDCGEAHCCHCTYVEACSRFREPFNFTPAGVAATIPWW